MYVVYRHFDKHNELLYVGQTKDEKARRHQHKANSPWFNDIASVTTEEFATRQEAIIAEAKAISEEQPLHNGNKQAAAMRSNKEFIREAKRFHSQFWDEKVTDLEGVRRTLQKACDHLGGAKQWAWRFGYKYHFVSGLLCEGVNISDGVCKLLGYKSGRMYLMKE